MTVAYPGAPGAFAHAACRALLPDEDALALPTFRAVAQFLADGDDKRGVLPIRNSIAGEVPFVRALIDEFRLIPLQSLDLPVRLHLLGLPNSALDTIRMVVSHPVALMQCSRSIAALGVASREAESTALAAQQLADTQSGVLASEEAARIYKLKVLKRDMQDVRDARTTFVLLERGR